MRLWRLPRPGLPGALLALGLSAMAAEAAAATQIRVLEPIGSSLFCDGAQVANDQMRQGDTLTLPQIEAHRFTGCTLNVVFQYVGNAQAPAAHRGIEAFDGLWRAGGVIEVRPGFGDSSRRAAGGLPLGMLVERPFPGADVYNVSIRLSWLNPVAGAPTSFKWYAPGQAGGTQFLYHAGRITMDFRPMFVPGPATEDPVGSAASPEIPMRSIPSVVGMQVNPARERIENFAGPNSFAVAIVHVDTIDINLAGMVREQSPPGGSTIPVGSTVTLTVNRYDASRRLVPSLVGVRAEHARAMLGDELQLTVDQANRVPCGGNLHSTTVRACRAQAGLVLAQAPQPGTEVAVGSRVQITVGEWPEPRRVPDVTAGFDIGAWWPEAALAMQRSGFIPRISPVVRLGCRAFGTVIVQHPAGGSLAEFGSEVELVLCGDCASLCDPGLHFHTFLNMFNDDCLCHQDDHRLSVLPLGFYFDTLGPGDFLHPRSGSLVP